MCQNATQLFLLGVAVIQKGTLYIVATPLGNLQDFSPRAQAILHAVDLIVAEDTRHSRRLLHAFAIQKPLQALHAHNEQQATDALLHRLQAGDTIALISDAGTPLISDPGFYFLQAVHHHHIPVSPIPGPSALISALSVAGFPADHFVFEGFLPAKAHARQQRLQDLKQETRTLVFYEAPHRLLASLTDMADIFGVTREAVLAKELTKLFETIHRSALGELVIWLTEQAERQKGEFVLIVRGFSAPKHAPINPEAERIFNILRQALSLKQAAKLTSEITGVSKNSLYRQGIE